MDKVSRCRSENPNETSSVYPELSEKKARSNIHQDLVNIANMTSQLQMLSDSLASYHPRSRHRPMRKDWNALTRGRKKSGACTPIEMFTEEITVEPVPRGQRKNVFVNYVMNDVKDMLYLRKSKTFTSREEILTKEESFLSEKLESCVSGSDKSQEMPMYASKVGMYDYREVDTGRMMMVLERELETLRELSPTACVIVSNLSENLSHCKGCRKCHDKISPSLPWILNRIQKLIKYVTIKRQDTYFWPNDFCYLRLNPSKHTIDDSISSVSSSRVTLIPVVPLKLVGKLEKIDPIAASNHLPGVEILLEVNPEQQKKKFFQQARNQPKFECQPTFPIVHLKERSSILVVQVLRPPTSKHKITWEKRQEVANVKQHGLSFPLLHLFNPRIPALIKILKPLAEVSLYETTSSQSDSGEEKDQFREKGLLAVLIEQTEWNSGVYCVWKPRANDQEVIGRALELEADLRKGKQEMQVHKVSELEEEVKELKDLMLEVHKNQTELGKLLMEKKVFSEVMIKLTDPKMLAEENDALRKASSNSSVSGLQMTIESLKRKCELKNGLILALLRGLRSNVPKELWEQVVGFAFDDSDSMEELNSEKINQIIRQTSAFLTKEEKERKRTPSPTRTELLAAEEEPKVKGIMGAEVENLENLSCYENQAESKNISCSQGFANSSARIWAFPVLNAPSCTETALRKLENQISVLNMENERLWHQVNELRELLKASLKEMSFYEFNSKADAPKTSGKTINLVIQIGEKDSRRIKDVAVPSEVEMSNRKNSPAIKIIQNEPAKGIHEAEKDIPMSRPARKLALLREEENYEANSKYDPHSSDNDLNCLNDVQDYNLKNEQLLEFLARTPHPSPHEMFQNFKPVTWVPSKYIIPEVYDTYGTGSLQKQRDYLLQKPSLMELTDLQCAGMYATIPNERELQTIPENDFDLATSTSRSVNQAIQSLRARVRSLHKDMTVLRSKNDRIDKLLDRLMDDIVENNHNYEELESNLSDLKSRLG